MFLFLLYFVLSLVNVFKQLTNDKEIEDISTFDLSFIIYKTFILLKSILDKEDEALRLLNSFDKDNINVSSNYVLTLRVISSNESIKNDSL